MNNSKTIKHIILFVLLCYLPLAGQISEDELSLIYLKSNLEFLASEELEGREATTRGEKVAALFIAQELQKYGVKPFGDSGTYFQDFEMEVRWVDLNSELAFVEDEEILTSLTIKDDLLLSRRADLNSSLIKTVKNLAFVNYGIDASDYGYNSYENVNVKDKFVVVLPETPAFDDNDSINYADIEKLAHAKYKVEAAKKNGAAGVIFLPGEMELKYWNWFKRSQGSKSFDYIGGEAKKDEPDFPVFYLAENRMEDLFNNENYNAEEIKSVLKDGKELENFFFEKKMSIELKSNREIRKARNVVGMLEGTDENLKSEFVSLGAHFDHEGIRNENIYFGADDNGSGTVTILDAARTLSKQAENKRSILFVFHTAEEKGLIGAKHFTNSIEYIDDIIVNINIDMVGRESADTIYVIGSDKLSTELHKIVEIVNRATSKFFLNYKFDDPADPQRLYYRSDHINYANKGIPIVFFYDYMKEDYHKPSDSVEKINFIKLLKMKKLTVQLALSIANLDHRLAAVEK